MLRKHASISKDCPAYQKEKIILKFCEEEKLLFPEVQEKYRNSQPRLAQTPSQGALTLISLHNSRKK
jgi:hypothetical protein